MRFSYSLASFKSSGSRAHPKPSKEETAVKRQPPMPSFECANDGSILVQIEDKAQAHKCLVLAQKNHNKNSTSEEQAFAWLKKPGKTKYNL